MSCPNNPFEISSPFTMGSCPAVNTSFPDCFAGMYAATGFGVSGSKRLSFDKEFSIFPILAPLSDYISVTSFIIH
jgi:hypothetical protein